MEKNDYFTITPNIVRNNKKLPEKAKYLFSDLVLLSKEKGYCWANNSALAKITEVTPRTITRYLSKLKAEGYITIKTFIDEKKHQHRHIFISGELVKVSGFSAKIE